MLEDQDPMGLWRNELYRLHVKSFGCLVCRYTADAHHLQRVPGAKGSGMGVKPGDQWCVPLCRGHHEELHRCGDEDVFWDVKGLDPVEWAKRTFKEWYDEHF
jgi:uncharacterized protein YjlB